MSEPVDFNGGVIKEFRENEGSTETFEVTAKVIEDRAERDAIYAKQATAYPQFAEYETKTTRVIPVVELARV